MRRCTTLLLTKSLMPKSSGAVRLLYLTNCVLKWVTCSFWQLDYNYFEIVSIQSCPCLLLHGVASYISP